MRRHLLPLACTALVAAAPPTQSESPSPTLPVTMPLREQATIRDAWLKERLDTIVPALMREQDVDMWVVAAREYLEDPVITTMLDAQSMRARRRTVLIFFNPGDGKPVERLTVSRYGLAGLFAPSWEPEKQPDQWARVAEITAARDPKRIALDYSANSAFGDGLTHSQYIELAAALPVDLRERIVPAEELAVGWLETRIPGEMALYPRIAQTAHAILAEGLSNKVIVPGKTTTDDVMWWYRERIAGLRLATWFQPSVHLFRAGKGEMSGDTVIERGDMLWTDFGITYFNLNTDTQHLAYVLKPGETQAPAGLRAGMAAANAVQDALIAEFRTGRTGNDMLMGARKTALAAGLEPTIYSHPLGYHGHGAGSAIGFWDDQQPSPRGEHKLRPNTVWSIELNAAHAVPEWAGQKIPFRLEEDAFFDGKNLRFIDGRQTAFHLIR